MKKIASLFLVVLTVFFSFGFYGCGEKDTATLYDISIKLSDKRIEGVMTIDFYNDTDNALGELKFNLHANAFRNGAKYSPISSQYFSKAYPNGINYGEMLINSVTSNGENLEYSVCGVDENILSVALANEVFPEERVSVTVCYTITLANVVARTGINEHTINLANFYPILCAIDENGFYECVYYSSGDPYYSECADYNVSITLDKDYTVASSGKFIKRENQGTLAKITYELKNARSFAFVVSDKFESITDNSTGIEIIYYFYEDENPLLAMQAAVKSIKLFEEKFGEYPYPTYSVVQTEFVQGGMEFPALVMISDNLEKEAYAEVVVHETAHQWWQTAVGNNEIESGFLDEGLAEYSVITFYEYYPEYNLTREQIIESSEKTYKTFCSVYDKLFGEVDTSMTRGLYEFKGEYEYVNIAYIKPCIMFDNLRKTIGDESFFKGLKKYYEEYKFKNAKPDDLVGIFEKMGKDTNGFFNSFFEGKDII